MSPNKENVGNLLRIHMEYWPSQVVLTAVELNLFAELGDDALTAEQLGKRLGLCHPRGTYDFFDALVALRFLVRHGDGPQGRYENIPGMRDILDQDKGVMWKGYDLWANLAKALKTGSSLALPEEPGRSNDPDYQNLYYADDAREFFHAMDSLQEDNFAVLAEKFDFSRYHRMTDVGCASGLLSRVVATRHPHLKITNFDLPSVTPYVQGKIEAEGSTDQISVVSGDFFDDDLPRADIITMGNILHNWGLDKKQALIAKAHESLEDGGALIVIETLIDDARRENAAALLMSLNMLIEFGDGFSFRARDFRSWCEAAGFDRFENIELAGPSSAAVAYKGTSRVL
ncbi:MAG: methyltransferase [Myxococcota bacterium]